MTSAKTMDDQFQNIPATSLASADQIAVEELAMRLVQSPKVLEARAVVARYWKGLLHDKLTSPRALETFENFIDEFMMEYAVKAAAGDPNYPRFAKVMELGHEWFGMKVRGARYGGDNPDTTYSQARIDPTATYVVTGRLREPRAADQSFSLYGDPVPRMNIETRGTDELKVEADGSFKIIVSPNPPADAPNAFKTDIDTQYFYTRDTRGDWERELPMEIRIERRDPPSGPAQTFDQIAVRTARMAIFDVASMGFYPAIFSRQPHNTMTPPNATPGGLVTQLTSFGNLKHADDEAIVITATPGGAAYFSLVLHDFTQAALDSRAGIISMNHAQAERSQDGSITFVVSVNDPGVHNWVNPMGWNATYAVIRWQGLPRGTMTNPPAVNCKLVKLKDLKSEVPSSTRWISADERREQIARHQRQYQLRFSEK